MTRVLRCCLFGLALMATQTALAGSAQGSFTVSITIVSSCTISAGTAKPKQAPLPNVRCNGQIPWRLASANENAASAPRQLTIRHPDAGTTGPDTWVVIF